MSTPEFDAAKMAYNELRVACDRLSDATAKAFPIGTIVDVTMGKHRIRGRVTGVNSFWFLNAGYITIENCATGKSRRLNAFYGGHDVEIVEVAS